MHNIIVFSQMFGLSQRFRGLRWAGAPLAVITTIVVSPIAGICELLFRMTFSLMTSLGVLRDSRQVLT